MTEWMGRRSASTGGAELSNVEHWDCGKMRHLRTRRRNLIFYPAHGMDHPLLHCCGSEDVSRHSCAISGRTFENAETSPNAFLCQEILIGMNQGGLPHAGRRLTFFGGGHLLCLAQATFSDTDGAGGYQYHLNAFGAKLQYLPHEAPHGRQI